MSVGVEWKGQESGKFRFRVTGTLPEGRESEVVRIEAKHTNGLDDPHGPRSYDIERAVKPGDDIELVIGKERSGEEFVLAVYVLTAAEFEQPLWDPYTVHAA